MNAATLIRRSKEIISSLDHCVESDRQEAARLLEHPARYLLIGEHPRYGDQHVWGFRHTIEEAAVELFRHEHRPSDGDLMVKLAYIYDLESEDYAKPIVPGPVERTVRIGPLVLSDASGILGQDFAPGDTVMIRSSGVSPVHFWEGTIVSEGRDESGRRVYSVEYDPWDEGPAVHEVSALRVFRIDPARELPYRQWWG